MGDVLWIGWLSWVLSPDLLCGKLEICEICQALRWSCLAWGRGVRAVSRLCVYTLAFALQLRKNHGKPSVRASERCLADQRRTRFVYSTWPSSSDSLDWPAWPLSPLAFALRDGVNPRSEYLPICRTRGSPRQL